MLARAYRLHPWCRSAARASSWRGGGLGGGHAQPGADLLSRRGTGVRCWRRSRTGGLPPLVEPPTVDPEPGGVDLLPETTLYSPLTFTVGQEQIEQYPGPRAVRGRPDAGAAQRRAVLRALGGRRARAAGAGVRLVLSTNDPTGRRLIVTIRPQGAGSIRVSARPDARRRRGGRRPTRSRPAADEAFHGFGGRHNAIDQRGNDARELPQPDEPVGAGARRARRAARPRTCRPNGPTGAYFVQSLVRLVAPATGSCSLRDELTRWRMASDRPDAWQVAASAPAARLRRGARPRRRARSARSPRLTGRQRVPPRWALRAAARPARALPAADSRATTWREVRRRPGATSSAIACRVGAYRIEAWEFIPAPDAATPDRPLPRARDPRAPLLPRVRRPRRDRHRPPRAPRRGDPPRATSPRTPTAALRVPVELLRRDGGDDRLHRPGRACAGGRGASTRRSTWAPTASCRTSASRCVLDMHFHDGSTGRDDAQPPARCSSTAPRAGRSTRYRPRTRARRGLLLHPRGLLGAAGLGARTRTRTSPGDETDRLVALGRPGRAGPRHAQPRRSAARTASAPTSAATSTSARTPTTKELFLRWAEWAALTPIFRLHGSVAAGTHAPWTYDAETVRDLPAALAPAPRAPRR